MKKTTKPKSTSKSLKPQRGQTFLPVTVTNELTPAIRKDNGANDFAISFAKIGNFIMAGNFDTFGIEDVYALRADIPVPMVDELFAKWTHRMKLAGRIQEIKGCVYDTPRFEIV